MAITVTNYGLALQSLVEGRVNLSTDEVWCMLVSNLYSFNQHTHKFKSSVIGEITGSGYSPGGQKVAFTPPTYDSATKTLKILAGNMAWPSVTFTGCIAAVTYVKRQSTPENAMPLLTYINFGEVVSRSAQAFYINWPSTGVAKLVVP